MKDSGSEGKIEWLRDRFINLKNENKKLKDKKARINSEMEAIRENKRQRIQQMTATLYQKNQQMQQIQQEIESIAEMNSGLEQEFENELGKKNKNSTEVGQIISSINNIYRIVEELAKKRNKQSQLRELEDTYITYEDENTAQVAVKPTNNSKMPNIQQMIKKLDLGYEYISDLVVVYEQLKKNKKKQLQESKKVAAEDNKQNKQKAASKGSPPAQPPAGDLAKPKESKEEN